jgi:hypothetical protein
MFCKKIGRKEADNDQRAPNPSSSWPQLSDAARKKNKEVLDEACRIMLSKQNGSPPSDPAATKQMASR